MRVINDITGILGITGGAGAGGFSPSDIPGLQLWLEASPTNTGAVEGGTIATWTDLSGNGYDAVQATEAQKPTLQLVNGIYVTRYDGTDDRIVAPALGSGGFEVSQPYTLVLVGKKTDTTHEYFTSSNIGLPRGAIADNAGGASGKWIARAQTILAHTTTQDTTFHTFVFVANGASSRFRVDGVEVVGDAGINSLNGLMIGANSGGGPGDFLTGDVPDVVLYDSGLSTADIEAVETHYAPKVTTLNGP